MSTYKICLIGEGLVGKSTLVKIICDGEYNEKYLPTIGTECTPVNIPMNNQNIKFNVWDCAGQEKYGGLRDGYFIQSKGAIFMFDTTDINSFLKIKKWIFDYERVCGKNTPIVIVGNKSESNERKILPKQIHKFIENLSATRNIKYYDISCKTRYNIYKPFDHLYRSINNNSSPNFSKNDEFNEENDELESMIEKLNDIEFSNNEQIDFSNITTEIHHNQFNFSK